MSHEVETMVSAQGMVPWHGLGTVIEDEGMTSARALELAGLDWTVDKVPAFSESRGAFGRSSFDEADNIFLTKRSSDGRALGAVGKNYVPLQNEDAFQFGDDIMDASGAHWITAGSLKHGSTVWMMMKMPETIKVDGLENETIQPYFMISNSHDGSSAITAAITPIRVVCNNTLTWGLQQAKRTFKVRHTRSSTDRLGEVRSALGVMYTYMDALSVEASMLLNSRVEYNEFLDLLVPLGSSDDSQIARTKALNKRDDLRDIYYHKSDLQDLIGTKWGALQSVVDYNDHHIKGRTTKGTSSAEKRFGRIMGPQQNITRKAHGILIGMP